MERAEYGKIRASAREAEENRDWDAALELWDRASRLSEADFWTHFFAVRAAMQLGRSDEALERLLALEATPQTEGAWAQLRAAIEEKRGRDDEAVDWWRRAASLQSDPYWALFGLARSLSRCGQHVEARETMAAALKSPSAERGGVSFAAALDMRSGMMADAAAKLAAFQFSADDRAKALLAGLPGMTDQAERWALYEAARRLTESGQVVDLGCWLGSLTVSLAMGLQENTRARQNERSVQAYDTFQWEAAHMDSLWWNTLPLQWPKDGDSFLPVFQFITAPWKRLIDVHVGDLLDVVWRGGSVAILSIDAMKSPGVACKIMQVFYPELLSSAVLFHQDFCHHFTWWIHLHHFMLHRHFKMLDTLENSGGVLFELVRPVSTRDIERTVECDLSDAVLAAEAFSFSMDQVAPADRGAVAVAYMRCELSNGRPERARDLLERYRAEPSAVRELSRISDGPFREFMNRAK